MKRSFGVGMIVDVLRGSKNKKLLNLGFDESTGYKELTIKKLD